ncbi:MAG: HDIG domain-containing protein [Bacillota bacterium]|nr:HDIG domain-containing protein [Bacillota bacterium]
MRVIYLIFSIVAISFILSIRLVPEQVSLVEGEIAGEDIYYNGESTTYESEVATEEARNQAASAVTPIYVLDKTVEEALLQQVRSYFATLSRVALNYEAGDPAAYDAVRQKIQGNYTDSVLASMLSMAATERSNLSDSFQQLISRVYSAGVREEEVEQARQEIAISIGGSTISGDSEAFLKAMLEGLELRYNEAYDAVGTAAAVEAAKAAVPPVQKTVRNGELLVSRGSSVTAAQIEALQALGLSNENSTLLPFAGLVLLVAMLMCLFYFYLRTYRRHVYLKRNSITLLGVVMIVVLLLCKLISLFTVDSANSSTLVIGFLLPVASASMLLAVLLDRDTAIMATALLSVFVGIIMDGEMVYALVALCSGLTGVICAARLNQRSQFVSASVYIILANLLVISGWGLLWQQESRIILISLVFGLVNGLLSAILAMGLLPFLESGFGITTVIRLLELSNSSHPLLKQLIMEAPGTYNHSVLVGNLAESAADAIGADGLLVRVASYYHDVGKLKRPHFYIENQRPGENPHDKLQPTLSALIITSHPSDSVKMLKEHHFPQEIMDIVEQHHGAGVLKYFYHRAKENALNPEDVKIDDYRYKGRRPQTKEAALVMLADSVQAAVQALSSGDKQQIENRIHEVIQGKVDEGQLNEAPLTFRDLSTIEQTFLTVLSGMHHTRISYPGQEKNSPPREIDDNENLSESAAGTESKSDNSPASNPAEAGSTENA